MKVSVQPEVNIGMVGHVDHGKTTLTEKLSQVWTDKHSEEIKRGISIRLGYADTAFYKCPKCPPPGCTSIQTVCAHCGSETELQRAVSFVDAPGHETLMATMLSGAALMDGALLLIAANEPCPQPQTKEHLMALEIAQVANIILVQNKIDLVTGNEARKNYNQIKKFTKGTIAENAPIVPVSAHHDVNIDVLIQLIEKVMNTPDFDEDKPARMHVARSFDVNKPGAEPGELIGGVLGGSLSQGRLKVGDEIDIRPGRFIKFHSQEYFSDTITTTVTSLISGGNTLDELRPGGLIGISTELDPTFTKSDSLIGTVLGKKGTLPPTRTSLLIECHLLKTVVGMDRDINVESIRMNEPLMLTVGSATTVGVVTSLRKKNTVEAKLKLSVCAEENDRLAISRRVGGRWRLIGYGIIK